MGLGLGFGSLMKTNSFGHERSTLRFQYEYNFWYGTIFIKTAKFLANFAKANEIFRVKRKENYNILYSFFLSIWIESRGKKLNYLFMFFKYLIFIASTACHALN